MRLHAILAAPPDFGHHFVFVGPAAAPKQTPKQSLLARDDSRPVDDHIELTACTDLDRHVDSERSIDLCGETRRSGLIPSSGAIQDAHVHATLRP